MKNLFIVKHVLILLCSVMSSWGIAQEPMSKPIPVLTLGTFHFDFPNLDKIQYAKDEMIDVLEPRYQDEINKLVNALSEFAPTIIVIERPVKMQAEIDSLYKLYQEDKYFLHRGEYEQIGFRLAKKLGINRIYCVDEWANIIMTLQNYWRMKTPMILYNLKTVSIIIQTQLRSIIQNRSLRNVG